MVLIFGHPTYNIYRADISTLFPGYANSDGAAGYFYLDTNAYENGVHTIQWTVADGAGNIDGIGSRYFTVQNTGANRMLKSRVNASRRYGEMKEYHWTSQLMEIPFGDSEAIKVKKGFRPYKMSRAIHADESGTFRIEIKELECMKIHLSPDSVGTFAGYMVVGERLRSLPSGSTLDRSRGIFYWQPGVGFLGDYTFVFVQSDRRRNTEKKIVHVKIEPKHLCNPGNS